MKILYVSNDYGELKFMNDKLIHCGYMQKTIYGKRDSVFGSLCGIAFPMPYKSFDGISMSTKPYDDPRMCKTCLKKYSKNIRTNGPLKFPRGQKFV